MQCIRSLVLRPARSTTVKYTTFESRGAVGVHEARSSSYIGESTAASRSARWNQEPDGDG